MRFVLNAVGNVLRGVDERRCLLVPLLSLLGFVSQDLLESHGQSYAIRLSERAATHDCLLITTERRLPSAQFSPLSPARLAASPWTTSSIQHS